MVEYRGYGKTDGWLSEKKLYADADAAWDFVVSREKVKAKNVIVVGQSVGTGIAAYLASTHQPKALVLLSGYSSLQERAVETPIFGVLARWFFRYTFPTTQYLGSLTNTCVVLAHGKQDNIIWFEHLDRLTQALPPKLKKRIVTSEKAGHNDLLFVSTPEISEAVVSCLDYGGKLGIFAR